MKFIDLFAGIGGFRYGLENCKSGRLERKTRPNGRQDLFSKGDKPNIGSTKRKQQQGFYTCVYSNEFNKYAAQIYKKHYGEIETRDIRTVNAEEIPYHDLLCAGFPCQSFSVAGKRKGFEDTRGTMFFEIARIAKHKRPRYLLLENVKGLLSHDKGKTFSTIIGILADLGYRVEWQVLNSKHFGVPQNRERVFIVGHLGGKGGRQIFPIGESGEENIKLQGQQTNTLKARYRADGDGSYVIESELNAQKGKLHYIGGVEGKRKKWLKDGKDKSRNFSQGQRIYSDKGISQTLAGNAGGQGGKTGLYAIGSTQKHAGVLKDTSPALTEAMGKGGGHTPMIMGTRIRRLTPTECERLQGFPDGWTEGVSDTQRYKCLGNAVTTNVITAIGEKITEYNRQDVGGII